jgi:hypothetical protein
MPGPDPAMLQMAQNPQVTYAMVAMPTDIVQVVIMGLIVVFALLAYDYCKEKPGRDY